MKLSGLNIYPVKALGGIALQNSYATDIGLAYDRRWMIVDIDGKFITQREFPILSQVSTSLSSNTLTCSFLNEVPENIQIHLDTILKESKEVQVWKSKLKAQILSPAINQWFSSILKKQCFVVYMANKKSRLRNFDHAPYSSHVSFADGYPYLFVNESSVEDLNKKIDQKLAVQRFRANMIISGLPPYEEEKLKEFRIGTATFQMVKPCARCVVINIDPKTSKSTKEPLRTLSSDRKNGNKVFFGMNAVCTKPGLVEKGQSLVVL